MNVNCTILYTLVALLAMTGQASAQTLYQDPIKIQPYVTNPADVVKQGMQRYNWEVESEKSNGLIAKLDYKGNVIRVSVNYSASEITFEDLSNHRSNCEVTKRQACEIKQDYIERWRSNLRRGITKAIHDLAIADAYAKLSK